jgi:hypothetical protein
VLEPIPFAGYVEIDESFDRTASHMAGEYVSYPAKTLTDEDLIEDLTHFVEKLHRRWGDDLWIDATDLMAIEKAIELLRKEQEK